MRLHFLRGFVTGGILGAALGMLTEPGGKYKRQLQGITGTRRNKSQVKGVLRNVSQTVNDVGKSVNEYIKK